MKLDVLKYLGLAICLSASGSIYAQTPTTDDQEKGEPLLKDVADGKLTDQNYAHMELQFNTSGHASFEDGKYSNGNFSINGVRMQISGQLTDGAICSDSRSPNATT